MLNVKRLCFDGRRSGRQPPPQPGRARTGGQPDGRPRPAKPNSDHARRPRGGRSRFRPGEFAEVRRLLTTAFPENELPPFEELAAKTAAENFDFLAFYDGGRFCGTACLETCQTVTFLLYLAVPPEMRSEGVGTEILRRISRRYRGNTIMLDIEAADRRAANYAQRVRRKAFYLRNGYKPLRFGFTQNGESYEILATDTDFSKERLDALFAQLSFGFRTATLYPLA